MKKLYLLFSLVLFALFSLSFVSGALTDGLVSYYNFSGSGADVLGRNNLTVTGATYGTGKIGQGGLYINSGDNMQINSGLQTLFNTSTTGMTMCGWFNSTDTSTNYQRVILFGKSTHGDFIGFQIRTDKSNTYTGWTMNSGTNEKYALTGVSRGTTSFKFLCLVSNSSEFASYVDGSFYNSSVPVGSPTITQLNLGQNTVATTEQFKGMIDEFSWWNRTLSSSEISTLYNSGVGLTYPFTIPSPNATIPVFVSQSPSNLSSTNLFAVNVMNITYNMSPVVNRNYSFLNYSIVSSTSRCAFSLNGVCYQSTNEYLQKLTTGLNTSDLNSFLLNDNAVYPATYSYNETITERTVHDFQSFTNSNDYLKFTLKNVSNLTAYNQFEVYLNNSGVDNIYYCNSSYSTGSVVSSSNCVLFNSFSRTGFNHSHNQSYHNVINLPINITSGTVNGIEITPVSYFVFRTISGDSRFGTINASCGVQVSNNNGNTYSNTSYCLDSHLHQYIGTESLNYSACSVNSSGTFCSAFKSDFLELDGFPPSSPLITNPNSTYQNVSEYINISWLPSLASIPSQYINNYSVSVLNSDLSTNLTLSTFNGTSYNWNTYLSKLNTGVYYIKVIATDNVGSSAFSISEPINITHNSKINITAVDYENNNTISSFNITLRDLNTGLEQTQSSSLNQTSFDAIIGNSYLAFINATGYAFGNQSIIRSGVFNFFNSTEITAPAVLGLVKLIEWNYEDFKKYNLVTNNIFYNEVKTNSGSYTISCFVAYNYSDGSLANSTPHTHTDSSNYVSAYYNNPYPLKNINSLSVYCSASGGTIYIKNNNFTIDYDSLVYGSDIFVAYPENSILFKIYDSKTNSLITSSQINFSVTNNISTQSYSTSSGSYLLKNLTEGFYYVTFLGTNYSTRTYTFTILNTTTQTLNAFLTSGVNKIGIYVRNSAEEPLNDALLNIKQLINTSYVTIAESNTDVIGFIQAELEDGVEYLITISATGYEIKQAYWTPYFANQPYKFKLNVNTSTYFVPFNEFISFSHYPTNSSLANLTYNFTFTTVSKTSSFGSSSILWTYANCSNNITNVSGSPSGSTILNEFDLSTLDYLTCIYGFQVDGYVPYYYTVNYKTIKAEAFNSSLANVEREITDSTPRAWQGILTALALLIVVAILSEFTKNNRDENMVLSVVGFGTLIIFAFIGFVNPIMTMILVVEAVILFYMNRGGY